MQEERNWAGNYRYNATELFEPEHMEQLQEWVAKRHKVSALGSRHSFNSIADTPGSLVSLKKMNQVLELDCSRRTVTVEGGIRYGELARYLHANESALPNLASLPHITVAGACATGTHGSGDRNGNLATAVRSVEIVTSSGEAVVYTRGEQPEADGAIVGLGALGVLSKLTLDIVPSFDIKQLLFENLALSRLESQFDDVFSSAYSVSLFTDWTAKPCLRSVRSNLQAAGADRSASIYFGSAYNCRRSAMDESKLRPEFRRHSFYMEAARRGGWTRVAAHRSSA